MKTLLRAAAVTAAMLSTFPAFAGGGYTDRNGTTVGPVIVVPYPFIPLSPGQHGLAPTSATALTVPTGALFATVCARTANVNYTTDGTTTPTGSIGETIYYATACIQLSGPTMIANFLAFSASGTLDVEYFK